MISRALIAIAGIISIILATLSIASINNVEKSDNKINIQLIREEIKLIDFNVVENIGVEESDIITIRNDGVALFDSKDRSEKLNINTNDLAKLRSLVLESGLMYIPNNEFNKSTRDTFIKYTLMINVDSEKKEFVWIEDRIEDEPSSVPPLLIHIKDTIYCITGKAELYSIRCS